MLGDISHHLWVSIENNKNFSWFFILQDEDGVWCCGLSCDKATSCLTQEGCWQKIIWGSLCSDDEVTVSTLFHQILGVLGRAHPGPPAGAPHGLTRYWAIFMWIVEKRFGHFMWSVQP
jgi:hypothetical protein